MKGNPTENSSFSDRKIKGKSVNKMQNLTRADKVSAKTIAEIMEDAVSVSLLHSGMDVVTRVAEFRDLLSEQLHTLSRVTEDNTLIYLQL